MITLRPSSGLCNRLRAIASGLRLAKECDEALAIDWYYCPIKRWAPSLGVAITYSGLFEDPNEFEVRNRLRIKYEMPWDRRVYKRAEADIFSEMHSEQFVSLCKQNKNDGSNKRFWTCYNFYESTDYSWLKPKAKILKSVDVGASDFAANTIGMHIRRTDNTWSIQHSPLELFTEQIEKEIDNDKDVKIFLATDSNETKSKLLHKYDRHIITRVDVSPRYTLKGEIDGLVDLLLLARTRKIYGSFCSSFSEIASHIGKCELKILTA